MRSIDASILVACLLALGFAFGFMTGRAAESGDIPRCPEDSVLVGVGNFESGDWDAYVCGPAVDDYAR